MRNKKFLSIKPLIVVDMYTYYLNKVKNGVSINSYTNIKNYTNVLKYSALFLQ